MKKALAVLILFTIICYTASAQLVAFPGAEGFGKYAKGARASSSPTVYHVTNLNDTGSGSFRDAVSASNRIVVFDVAGVINITSRIVCSSNIYIAGQTAPGEGVTVYGNGFSYSGADNVICRYLRMRMGAIGDSGKDGCGIANGSNMIFDHVSVSWGRDETFSVSGSECINITIQNSVIAQGLLSHSAGGLIQTDGGVTLYRNVYIDNDTRNNKIKGVNQYVNNMVYNWSSGCYLMGGDSEGTSYANCQSNYFINGPMNSVPALSGANSNYNIFASDNWWDKNRNGQLDGYLVPENEYSGGPTFQTAAYNYPVVPMWPATSLVDSLLPNVGASLPYRDLIDCYVIDQLKSFGKKGLIITNETENPVGTPASWSMWTGSKRTDTDNDGIPDAWESANGLNPNLASDATALSANGYLNIENYINSITANNSQAFLRAPLCLVADSTTQNAAYLSWFDFTDKEKGYCVEKKINGTYTEISRTGINGHSFILSGLQPERRDTFRVRAYIDGSYSTYSNELITKTKPIPVLVLDLNTFKPDLTWVGGASMYWDKATVNWKDQSASSVLFTDSVNVLFAKEGAKTVYLNDPMTVNSMVVSPDSASTYTFLGGGYITGKGSVNKTGSGNLSMQTNNTYTGATVLYSGTLEVNKLANGGLASSIGASQNYDFNCVLKGGKFNYTGATVSTDRNILLEGDVEFGVGTSGSVLTINGLLSGTGGLTKSGAGTLLFKGLNSYEGLTSVNAGQLEINGLATIVNAFTANNSYKLNGGYLKTSGGSNTVYADYYSNFEVAEGKTSYFEPYRNCYIHSKFSGTGTLYFNITYVREYLQGDFSQFSGTIYANAIGTTADGNQFMLNNTTGIPNARVVMTAGTKTLCWKNASTMYLGGLSGPSGSWLSGADKQNNAATMTWIIGGAGTDETFSGVINNECSNKSYKGVTTIVKDGKGYWKLTGANLYTGTTTVKGGMLIVNGAQVAAGKVTVMADATLAGKGSLPSVTEVQSGGTISAGDPTVSAIATSVGTLTTGALTLQSGSLTRLRIDKTSALNDKIASSGVVTFGGTLNLGIFGTLQPNDQFTLFTGTSYAGTFSKIVPETPGDGMMWLFGNGILKAVTATGIDDVKSTPLKIGTNPVKDKTILYLDQSYSNLDCTVESLDGKQLLHQQASNLNRVELNLSSLPKGIYMVKVTDGKELNVSAKVLKN
jgi:autotransporter-associated beta strand protein